MQSTRQKPQLPRDAGDKPETTIVRSIPKSRGYQQEMLEESLQRNIVIALDTGAGKTHIAVIRMKLEVERESRKVCWFLAPTVALANQQHRVISTSLPVTVGLISGANEPDQWKDIKLWQGVLSKYRIVVTTHDVLLNALRHGFISLGRDVNLIVFDEAHHAADKHPYNLIMQEFYFALPRRPMGEARLTVPSNQIVRPMILGLTASPIFGGDVEKAFRKIEANLDSTIRAPQFHRAELSGFVHRPEFRFEFFEIASSTGAESLPTASLISLRSVVDSLDINNDPFVKSLRSKLSKLQPGPEYTRTDQRLSRSIHKEDTFTHKGLRDFCRAADDIHMELGTWAADWYIFNVVQQVRRSSAMSLDITSGLSSSENRYLLENLALIQTEEPPENPETILARSSDKVRVLIEALLGQKAFFEALNEDFRALVFVTRRDAVLALSEILARHPRTNGCFQVGSLLGNSDNSRRHTFLDITRQFLKKDSNDTLDDFRAGNLDVIIATAVAEEGLDIQACCSVIRWDAPPNMVSWAQSRGRARQKRSIFTVMYPHSFGDQKIQQWRELEARMNDLANQRRERMEPEQADEEDDPRVFKSPSTGATLTLNSAVEHLTHFCSILPWSGKSAHTPVFDISPHEYPPEWHNYGGYLTQDTGPFGCTVVLPRQIDASFRTFSTPTIHRSKVSARRHVAFQAYLALYENGLLDEHLLPLMSTLEPEKEEEVQNLLKEVEKRRGTEEVTSQIDPWLPTSSDETAWWMSEVHIDGLPAMRLLTMRPLAALTDDEMPVLHSIDRGSFKATVRSQSTPYSVDDATLSQARNYTRHLITPLYGTKLKWEKVDFAFLFLPVETTKASVWDKRRSAYEENSAAAAIPSQPLFARAEWFGQQFQHPHDIYLVGEVRRYGKLFRFLRWRITPVTEEERAALVERYDLDGVGDLDVTYPLLEVVPLTSRMNFLIPVPVEAKGDAAASQRPVLLLPEYSTIGLLSSHEARFALWAPSILRYLAMANTAIAMREALLRPSLSHSIMPLPLLLEAITAPVAQEQVHYQRLEILGDCVLKFLTSVNLLAEHRYWHEGYLSRRKDHVVSNTSLAKAAVKKKLYLWIIRDRFSPRKWKPVYTSPETEILAHEKEKASSDENGRGKGRQDLSTKVLADVVESNIGAAYIYGNFDLATACINMFEIGLSFQPPLERVNQIRNRVEDFDFYPTQLAAVEQIIGHTFERRALLVEALTHASYQSDLPTISYERMEFLGDSVLDIIVTDYLYHAPGKHYSPGQIHLRKMAVVNTHFLAAMCLRACTIISAEMPKWTQTGGLQLNRDEQRVYLWQCLLHSSASLLGEQYDTFARWNRPTGGQRIEYDFMYASSFPWAPLVALQAPKFLSDMVESLLGAVYIDTHGSLDACRQMLGRLGLTHILERIVRDDVRVQDPVSQLRIWAAKRQEKIELHLPRGRAVCTVRLDGYEVLKVEAEWRGRASQEDAKFSAAQQVLQLVQDPVSRLELTARKLEQRLQCIIEEALAGPPDCVVILGDTEIVRFRFNTTAMDDVRRFAATEALKRLEDPIWRLSTWTTIRQTDYEFVWDTEKVDGADVPVCILFVAGKELVRKRKRTKRWVQAEVERALGKRAMAIIDEQDRQEARDEEAARKEEILASLPPDGGSYDAEDEGVIASAWDGWEATIDDAEW